MYKKISSALLIIASVISGSCSSNKKAITTSPSPVVVTPNRENKVDVDVDFNIPAHYFSQRSRLFITPAYMVGDSILKEYKPIVLDAPIYTKKTLRKIVLDKYVDPYFATSLKVLHPSKGFSVKYNKSLQLPEKATQGRIVAVTSADGCGACTGLDTIEVGMITIPNQLIDMRKVRTMSLHPAFKVTEKIHKGNGEARLQFIVDKWDIVMDLANNRKELSDMLATLEPILNDSLATLTSLNIFGSASAEASYNHNIMLANNRAKSAKNWLTEKLNLPAKVRNIIKVGARPEGWEPVVQAMIAAGDPDSIKVRELMIKYPGPTDDAAEKYIRRLACWPRIRERYLAKDRKVLYDYSWTVKNFTNDAEMIEIYKTRPDALSLDEFLRVAELATDDDSRAIVYEKLLKFFPESETAKNNLASILIAKGKSGEASDLLEGIPTPTVEMLNNLAVTYLQTGEEEKAYEILNNINSDEARYNLGLLKASLCEMEEAYELLKPFADINAAICAIGTNRNDEAESIMGSLSDQSAQAEYIRAIIAARKGDRNSMEQHLQNAVSDPELQKRAATEPDFMRFKDSSILNNLKK